MQITDQLNTTSLRSISRSTALLYLLLAVIGPFSLVYMPSTLIVPGDVATTVSNISNSIWLFRGGIVGEALIFLIEIAVPVLLYMIFRSANKTMALLAAFSRLAMALIQGVNLFNLLIPLMLISGAGSLTGADTNQLHNFVSLFLDAHQQGVYIWQLAFALHLLVLGYLVIQSGYLPKIIGGLLALGSLGYFADSFGNILLPGNEMASTVSMIFLLVATAGELGFMGWLFVKGVNTERWEKYSLTLQSETR